MKFRIDFASGLIAAVFSSAALAQPPQRLSTFSEVMNTLKSGSTVRAVFNYKQCKLMGLKSFVANPVSPDETNDPLCQLTVQNKPQSCYVAENESVDAIGGLQISTWEYFGPGFIGPKAYVSSSDAKLISIRGFVVNYGSVKIFDDNSVVIKVNYLKVATEIPSNPLTQRDVPLMMRRDASGGGSIVTKKLAVQEQVITMDEMFLCSIDSGNSLGGASLFVSP